MTKLNLDLGKSYKDSMPMHMSMPDRDEPMYPEFTFESDEKIDLPHEGFMLIRYRKKASEQREDSDGDEHYSCRVCVEEVVSVEAKKSESRKDTSLDSEDALDKLARKKQKEKRGETEDY